MKLRYVYRYERCVNADFLTHRSSAVSIHKVGIETARQISKYFEINLRCRKLANPGNMENTSIRENSE